MTPIASLIILHCLARKRAYSLIVLELRLILSDPRSYTTLVQAGEAGFELVGCNLGAQPH